MNPPQNEASESFPTRLDIYSLSHLEALLGRSRAELADLAKHAVRYYKPFQLGKKERPFAKKPTSGRKRLIDNPIDPLKAIQSRIEERLLKRLILPEHLLGGVRGKAIKDNAKLHLNARCLVIIDIKNFFPSIKPEQVRAVWCETLNCSPDVAYLLTGLTTFRGRLPQGAPTSMLLANLVLSTFDGEIRAVCRLNGVSYSSWVDDLAFSGDSAHHVVAPVIATLMKAGFRVSHRKISVMGPGERKMLNKLVLGRFVSVPKQYIGRIRAGIYHLRCGDVAAFEIAGYVESLKGSINYLRLFDIKKMEKLQQQLKIALRSLEAKHGLA